MIVFVADKPSSKNKDPNIALVGTESYRRFLDWVWRMDLSVNDLVTINKDDFITNIDGGFICIVLNGKRKYIDTFRDSFVALGNNASKKLSNMGLEHFHLPHPSPRNFKNNNKDWLEQELKNCREWLHENYKG